MAKRFWFKSSRASDKCSAMCVSTNSATRAIALAARYFIVKGFKGEPQLLAV